MSRDFPTAREQNLQTCAINLNHALTQTTTDVLEIARNVGIAERLCRTYGNGNLDDWLTNETEVPTRFVPQLLRLNDVFGGEEPDQLSNACSLQALCFLASGAAPPAAISRVFELIKNGERVGINRAREIVDEFTFDSTVYEDDLDGYSDEGTFRDDR